MISSNAFYITGRSKFEAQDYQGALDDYSIALKEEENPSIYSERAVVYYYLKQLDKSLDDMNYAASLEPNNPYRYSSRAYIKDALGDTQGAIDDYERAIQLDPDDSIAYNNLGLLQEKLGYKDKADRNYERADQLADVDKLLNKIRLEQKDEALASPAPLDELSERKEISLLALLRQTFLTRTGFREYLSFIRRGLKDE